MSNGQKLSFGLFPYDDGSGFQVEVRLHLSDGVSPEVVISQNDDDIRLSRDQWDQLRGAMWGAWHAFDELAFDAKEDA